MIWIISFVSKKNTLVKFVVYLTTLDYFNFCGKTIQKNPNIIIKI